MKRRDVLRSLLAAPFILRSGKASAAAQPNIILLIFDDMAFEQMQRMPNLLKLGLTGVNFLSAYANTAICQTARMTLLTGQYSHNHGLVDNSLTGYPVDHTTMLAARLQAAGYQTSHVGKYFNSWDNNVVPSGWTDWHNTSALGYYNYPVNDNGVVSMRGTALSDYQTTVCREGAKSFIASAVEPFFLQASFKAPHFDTPGINFLNANPDPAYTGVIPTSRQAPRLPNFNVQMGTPPNYMLHDPMDTAKIAEVDAFYRGSTEMLFSADQAIAAIVAAFNAAGKTNTIVIATSDNGYFRGEGRNPAGKVAPYIPALRVPLIISGPGAFVAQGKMSNQLTCHVDIAPTIYALAGATSPSRVVDGVSMTSLMLNPNTTPLRNYLLLEWLGDTSVPLTGWSGTIPRCQVILTPRYLFNTYSTGEQEMFDLSADPNTLVNVVNQQAYSADSAILKSRAKNSQSCSGSGCILM